MEKQDNSGKQNAKFLGNIKELHTPLPWVIRGEGTAKRWIDPNDVTDNIGQPVCELLGADVGANSRRIVACVNFCAGFPIEQIESSSLEIQMKKMRQLSGDLGKAWGNQNTTPTGLATDRDLALMVLKDLIFAARTSGGTAGPDKELMSACEAAEIAYNKIQPPAYFIATEDGIADIESPPSDN